MILNGVITVILKYITEFAKKTPYTSGLIVGLNSVMLRIY